MNGKRLGTLLLAGSLGLNVALGGVLIYQIATREKTYTRGERGEWRGRSDRRDRDEWQSHYRARSDTTRPFPRLERDQILRLREMRNNLVEVIRPLRAEINTLQALMREELVKPQPDPARLDSMAVETARLQSQIQQHSLRLILEEREVLTAEQYQAVVRMMLPGQFGSRESGRSKTGEPPDRDPEGGSRRSPRSSPDRPPPPPAPHLSMPHLPMPHLPMPHLPMPHHPFQPPGH